MKLRIIDDGPCSAAFNMAADLYLLDICSQKSAVFLRLYEWDVPTVSLGYMQTAADMLDLAACAQHGVTWIRRPTGGRAVLHHEDLTYSCIFSKGLAPLGASIAETSDMLGSCLMKGFALSGIDCQSHDSVLDAAAARRETKLPCFLAPNRREIMYQGKKLVGSAQKRTATAVLQHGSIPLTPAFRRLPTCERISPAQRESDMRLLDTKCACLTEISPECNCEALAANLKRGFASVLGFECVEEPWRESEVTKICAMARSDEFKDLWMR